MDNQTVRQFAQALQLYDTSVTAKDAENIMFQELNKLTPEELEKFVTAAQKVSTVNEAEDGVKKSVKELFAEIFPALSFYPALGIWAIIDKLIQNGDLSSLDTSDRSKLAVYAAIFFGMVGGKIAFNRIKEKVKEIDNADAQISETLRLAGVQLDEEILDAKAVGDDLVDVILKNPSRGELKKNDMEVSRGALGKSGNFYFISMEDLIHENMFDALKNMGINDGPYYSFKYSADYNIFFFYDPDGDMNFNKIKTLMSKSPYFKNYAGCSFESVDDPDFDPELYESYKPLNNDAQISETLRLAGVQLDEEIYNPGKDEIDNGQDLDDEKIAQSVRQIVQDEHIPLSAAMKKYSEMTSISLDIIQNALENSDEASIEDWELHYGDDQSEFKIFRDRKTGKGESFPLHESEDNIDWSVRDGVNKLSAEKGMWMWDAEKEYAEEHGMDIGLVHDLYQYGDEHFTLEQAKKELEAEKEEFERAQYADDYLYSNGGWNSYQNRINYLKRLIRRLEENNSI